MPMSIKTNATNPSKSKDQKKNNACSSVLQKLTEFPGKHSAVVGLSGGVDSSLSAVLLHEAGWQIEGLTLWLLKGQGSCCSD